jgi:hypothetical protein
MTAIKYTAVSEPRFANAEGTMIDCLVVFPSISREPLPYTAAEVDPDAEHCEEIFARCLAGEFGPVAPFVEVQPIAEPRRVPEVASDTGHRQAHPQDVAERHRSPERSPRPPRLRAVKIPRKPKPVAERPPPREPPKRKRTTIKAPKRKR